MYQGRLLVLLFKVALELCILLKNVNKSARRTRIKKNDLNMLQEVILLSIFWLMLF